MASPAQARIQAFERDTGRTVRWRREDMSDLHDCMRKVRASSTLPSVMVPIKVDGQVCYDGCMGEGGGIPLNMAEEDGYERFVFVATRPRGYRKQRPTPRDERLNRVLAAGHPRLFEAMMTRWERYNEALAHVEELEAHGHALLICPEEMPISSGTLDQEALLAAYDEGHAQGLRELPRWRRFLFGSADGGPRRSAQEVARLVAAADDPVEGYVTIG